MYIHVVQLVSDVETALLSALSSCQSSVNCQLALVRGLGNARLPGSVNSLVELAVSSPHCAVSEAALSSLTRFDADDLLHSTQVRVSHRHQLIEQSLTSH